VSGRRSGLSSDAHSRRYLIVIVLLAVRSPASGGKLPSSRAEFRYKRCTGARRRSRRASDRSSTASGLEGCSTSRSNSSDGRDEPVASSTCRGIQTSRRYVQNQIGWRSRSCQEVVRNGITCGAPDASCRARLLRRPADADTSATTEDLSTRAQAPRVGTRTLHSFSMLLSLDPTGMAQPA